MDDALPLLIDQHPHWRSVLLAYADAESTAVAVVPPANAAPAPRTRPWVTRLPLVEGVPTGELAPIHGKLIAQGLLQFSLEGRDAGVRYQLTREARQILARCAEQPDDISEAVDDERAAA
jgi:hypothetical protein